MPEPTSVRQRRRRTDAVENEQKVRAAASQVFDALGAALTMDDVAAAAGVSKGTVYKTFGTRDELVHALTVQRFAEAAHTYRTAARSADPWQGLVDALSTATVGAAASYEILDLDRADSPAHDAVVDGVAAMGELLSAAKAQGHVRPEITAFQVMSLFRGLYAVLPAYTDRSPTMLHGFVEIILRGIHV